MNGTTMTMNLNHSNRIFMLYLMHWHRKLTNTRYKRMHSRYKKRFHKKLSAYQRRIRQCCIPRPALHDPSMSAWRVLYQSKHDQALITLMRLDFETFDWLADKFAAYYDSHSPWLDVTNGNIVPRLEGRGRPRLLTAIDCLGLCLAWTRTRGSCMVLQIIFGMTAVPVSLYLRFSRRILIEVLTKEPDAAIKVPDLGYMDAISQRHPILDGVWCSRDGLKLYLETSADRAKENNFYNGWKHDHYVGAVIVFCPDGTIPICCFNIPGSVHDSLVAEWGCVHDKLGRVYDRCGGKCTVDSSLSHQVFSDRTWW